MSGVFISRVRSISDEFVASRGALAYVARNWQKLSVFNDTELEVIGPHDIQSAADNLEVTFIIRLFAAFEGMLKEHIGDHHRAITLPEDVRVVWLIDRVATLQARHIDPILRNRVHQVRGYRNALVHAAPTPATSLTFPEVRSCLNTYLDKLPEPLR